MSARFPRVASLESSADLRARLAELGCPLPCDDEILSAPDSPLAAALVLPSSVPGDPGEAQGPRIENRWVVQPMEGWDGTSDGMPTELTRRRWQRFGQSGAGWIWGGEAVAVRADGRANPHQLWIRDETATAIGALRRELLEAARGASESGEAAALQRPPLVGLQLTHSGRWSRPTEAGPAPRIAFRHPVLDPRVGVDDDTALWRDEELEGLARDYARAAALAQAEGFDFVDLKHCHGYLLHEFLAARGRPGRFGGPRLEDRTRLCFEILDAVHDAAPGLAVGVRLSAFDRVPHRPADAEEPEKKRTQRLGPGVPEPHPRPYDLGFGIDREAPDRSDLRETVALVRALVQAGVRWFNVSAGSPYYVPHIQRPAAFPPSDGYAPPEDPLAGVARLLGAARTVKEEVPEAIVVSTGWTYLQDYLPHVAQACLRQGWFDAVGLGRMMLSYPDLPADVMAGRSLQRRLLCRTFSDCTTAPRHGMVSGCYPLDDFYKRRPERESLEKLKRGAAESDGP
jgi:2,4-dienoyl-CoA reductase-like NADH-dependent reductase (Old Yellow Enzyme family)